MAKHVIPPAMGMQIFATGSQTPEPVLAIIWDDASAGSAEEFLYMVARAGGSVPAKIPAAEVASITFSSG